VTAVGTVTGETPARYGARESPRAGRWPAVVFGVVVVAALPVWLWFGRDHWFFLDEWWGLARSKAWDPGYLDGHNGQWSTLTRLQYRLTFELWGLRTYLPYQVPVVLAHLVVAALVRQVSIRCGVRGWIATAVAVAFVFFGSGHENVLFGWSSSMTGSLVCGLGLFLLADGPPAVTRRDWLGLLLGVVGLMTSSVFMGLVVGLGVATVLRRGLRVAAFYTIPLTATYVAWYLRYGSDSAGAPLQLTRRTLWFVGRMFWAVFDALAQGGVGAALVVLAGVGLATALYRTVRTGDRTEAALPAGLCVAWLAFSGMTALARAEWPFTQSAYGASRYVHVGAALLLPVVALGIERLARRHAVVGAIALVPLAVGVPGNVDRMVDTPVEFTGGRDAVLAIAHSPYVDDVPPDTMPLQVGALGGLPVTAGWLEREAAAGRIPEPEGSDPVRDLTATSKLVLVQDAGADDGAGCPPLSEGVPLALRRGDQLRFDGAVTVTVTGDGQVSFPRSFDSRGGSAIRALAGPVDVVVRPAPGLPVRLCTPSAG